MGEVSEKIKGGTPAARPDGNLKQQVQGLVDEVSRLTAIKDEDTVSEGADARPENTRKAATLRAANSLLRGAKALLEDY